MTLKSREHYEMMDMFEKLYRGRRLDRENKSLWPQGNVYQHGEVNELFLAFRKGVAYGQAIAR